MGFTKYINMRWLNRLNKWLDDQSTLLHQEKCPHKEWDMDTQIKVIKCRECGKTAWVREYRDLFQYHK